MIPAVVATTAAAAAHPLFVIDLFFFWQMEAVVDLEEQREMMDGLDDYGGYSNSKPKIEINEDEDVDI